MTGLTRLLGLCLALASSCASQHPQHHFSSSVSSTTPPTPSWAVTASSRSIEVGGSITREQQVVTLKAVGDGSEGEWWLPLDERRLQTVGWLEVTEGKKKAGDGTARKLEVRNAGFDPSTRLSWFRVKLPSSASDSITLTISSHYTHLTAPKPERLSQDDGAQQGMLWEGDLLGGLGQLEGAISSDAEIWVKLKTPTPLVYGKAASAGFTVSQNAGSSSIVFQNRGTALTGIELGSVHYNQPEPVIAIGNWSRLVEVSHWGNNVAVEDKIRLENRGPGLKGYFSRIAHQSNTYLRKPGAVAHILTSLTLRLPPHVTSPYYVDTIGNVSTSRFRSSSPPSATQSKLKKNRARGDSDASVIEFVPRYPIVGGWNYSFTLGWNVPAGDWLKEDKDRGGYLFKVPMFTPIKDAAIDEVSLRVRLPEGSKNIHVWTPFPADSSRSDLVDKTFLDTTGRPVVLITKSRCTERHSSDVYISYQRSPLASFQKPAAVAAWLTGIFLLGGLLQRLEWKIGH